MNKSHYAQVAQIQIATSEARLLTEAMYQDSPLKVTAAAIRIESLAHQIVGLAQAIQNRENFPNGVTPEEAMADHVIYISGDTITVRKSRTLPSGSHTLTEDDRENLIEAIENAVMALPFSDEPLPIGKSLDALADAMESSELDEFRYSGGF